MSIQTKKVEILKSASECFAKFGFEKTTLKSEKRIVVDKIIQFVAKPRKRKSGKELFLNMEDSTPLDLEKIGPFQKVLEAVRLAPSAGNLQPWRILFEAAKNTWHFYLHENRIYNNMYGEIKLQNIDMGIAMCHFEIVAKELSISGIWRENLPMQNTQNLKYIGSFIGK